MASGTNIKNQIDSSTPSRQPPKKYKLVFIGEQGVGKTSIITRFMYDTFEQTYQATVGIDFLSKTMYTEARTVRLQLWDTAGQERFRCLVSTYIRDSTVALLVFDITNRGSFTAIDKWVKEVSEIRKNPMIVILGNKCDLNNDRAVFREEAESKAKSYNASYHEVSAKHGTNVSKVFRKIASDLPLDDDINTQNGKSGVHPHEYNVSLKSSNDDDSTVLSTFTKRCCGY